MKSHKIWAIACLLIGIVSGIAGIAALFMIISSSSKRSAYNIGMSILFILISAVIIGFGIRFLQVGKNKLKSEKLKQDLVETLSSLAPGA